MADRPHKIPKADAIEILRRAGFPAETIQALELQLDDPIDYERDAAVLEFYGVTPTRLSDAMGGSP